MDYKKVTIDIVAEKAGVSKTTISRYINGHYSYMSEETKQRIKDIIMELDYRPNTMAQNLKSKKSGLVGVIVSDITSTFSSILVKGALDYCSSQGYQTIVAVTDDRLEKEQEYITAMLDRQVEGLIINTTGNNEDFLEALKAKGIMMSLADRTLERSILDTVTTDNEEMTKKSVQTLYKLGFEKVAFFSEELKNTTRMRRYNAFLGGSGDYINDPNSLVYIIDENNNKGKYKSYIDALSDFYASDKDKNKAVLAINGVTLLNLLHAAKQLNLEIPYDIGVCGFDDWGWASIVVNGISVISQPSYEIGMKSAELLISRIKNGIQYKDPIYIELKSQLILRGSTDLNGLNRFH